MARRIEHARLPGLPDHNLGERLHIQIEPGSQLQESATILRRGNRGASGQRCLEDLVSGRKQAIGCYSNFPFGRSEGGS